MSGDLSMSSAVELASKIRSGQISSVAVVERCLERIDSVDSGLGAFLHVDREGALQAATRIDKTVKNGNEAGPLAGVPVAIKDIISVQGLPTTCASRILEKYVSPFDATVVTRLKAAGAIVIGKTNLDEFAMGSSTRSSAFQLTRNPWDTTRVPGGSSGGSAVAVSAGMTPIALGSDTGGSVRQPAALCGISGIKPTWGTNSRYGLVAYASSLDQIGCMGRTAVDLAATLSIIAGYDPLDATTGPAVSIGTPQTLLSVDVAKMRVGWIPKLLDAAVDPEISSAIRLAAAMLAKEVGQVTESALPFADQLTPVYYIIAMSEASSNLSRFDGVRYSSRAEQDGDGLNELYTRTRGAFFGEEVQRRILLGTHSLSAGYYKQYYEQASRVRRLVQQALLQEFRNVDVILLPTTATPAGPIDGEIDPVQTYRSDQFTVAANLAGLPAISIPCGFSIDGLPIGLQAIAAPHREDVLLSLAHRWQQLTDWHDRRPVV